MNYLSGFFGTPFSLALDIGFLIALSIFLFFFLKAKDKNNAYIMIVILTLSYVGFPILNLYTTFVINNRTPTKIEGCIAAAVNVFNLYWTIIYALYTYRLSKSILEVKAFSFVQFFTKAVIFSFIVSSIFPLLVLFNVWGDSFHFFVTGSYTIGYYIEDNSPSKLSYLIIRDGIGRLLPTLATSVCYYKLYYLLKDSKAIVSFSGPALRRLFWSSILPVLCTIPGVLNDVSDYFAPLYFSPSVSITVLVLRYFWEFLNLWAYWKLNPTAVGRERLESCIALNSTFEL